MTRRLPVASSPGPLEDYALRFDDLLRARAQREGFRRYLEGLLLPAERNKTLTTLANTERPGLERLPGEDRHSGWCGRCGWYLAGFSGMRARAAY